MINTTFYKVTLDYHINKLSYYFIRFNRVKNIDTTVILPTCKEFKKLMRKKKGNKK